MMPLFQSPEFVRYVRISECIFVSNTRYKNISVRYNILISVTQEPFSGPWVALPVNLGKIGQRAKQIPLLALALGKYVLFTSTYYTNVPLCYKIAKKRRSSCKKNQNGRPHNKIKQTSMVK